MRETDQQEINFPEWTEYQKKNGLDPLGMQNSCVSLYQTFLPGISNVTLRMRYYGLYAWLCRTYAQKDGSDDPVRWKTFLRRAEALYALAAFRAKNQSGVAGIQWAQTAFESATSDRIDFAAAADPDSETKYLKQPWGAYGAAYGSQLFAIGIFWESPEHGLPVPSELYGQRLAEIFENDLGPLAKLFAECAMQGTATAQEIDQLIPIVPSEIPPSGEERALYQDLLLSPTEKNDSDGESRRRSLLLVLEIAKLLKREPSAVEVRWILYAGQDESGHPLTLPTDALEDQRQRWWVYQASDLCHIVYETLFKFALDTLGAHPRGLTIDRLVALCVEQLLAEESKSASTWTEVLAATVLSENAYSAEDQTSEYTLTTAIMSRVGRRDESNCPAETAWKAVEMLATLHKRIKDEDHPVEQELGGKFETDAYQTLLTETRFLDEHEDKPLAELLARIIETKIIRRHLWIAARKFQSGDYTFLIDADEGRLRLRDKDGPVFTNPRLGPAITFLRDIHLIGEQGLTTFGAEAVAAA